MNRVIAVLFLLALVPGAAGARAADDLAAELRVAQEALKEGKYQESFAAYRRAAEQNSPLAQFSLGLFYRYGWGRTADPAAYCQWMDKAAHGGIPAATHFFAQCLERGIGRPADPAAAAVWYRKAVDLGYLGSLCSLGNLYQTGLGVPKDPAQGLQLCQKAAEGGLIPSAVRMGRMYLEGAAETRDAGKAYQWFSAAAGRGAAEAQYYLGVMEHDGIGRAKAPDRALFWFESAAAQGYGAAYFPTARLYCDAPADPETRKPTAENLAKSYLWLSATLKRSEDEAEKRRAGELLAQLRRIMPDSWVPALDEKVTRHLADHPLLGPSD